MNKIQRTTLRDAVSLEGVFFCPFVLTKINGPNEIEGSSSYDSTDQIIIMVKDTSGLVVGTGYHMMASKNYKAIEAIHIDPLVGPNDNNKFDFKGYDELMKFWNGRFKHLFSTTAI